MNQKPDKTDWHRLWGLMVSPLFERLGCDVTVEMDLSFKVQRLDMTVITKNKPLCFNDINPDYYQGFENLNDHNLISFKSFNEVFNRTAIEELYGHFTNYKKIKEIKKSAKVNLYAVTHHFPRDLFKPFQRTDLLKCIIEDRVYDLNVFTPVRFIITNSFDHPILGLFSNNRDQINKSLNRLKKDGWLLKHVSSYLKKMFEYYSLEGINMAYTREMFLKDNYPEDYEKILLVKDDILKTGIKTGIQKGIKTGIQKGMLSEAREMVLEALEIRYSSNVPEDVHKIVNALNNRILLKKLHRSAFQSKDIDSFKKTIQEIPPEQMQEQ